MQQKARGMCLPAVVPPEHEVRGLVGEHLAVGQGLRSGQQGRQQAEMPSEF